MTRVLVTGGSGKLGRACVDDLLQHEYEVVNLDVVAPKEQRCPFIQIDLTDFGQTLEAFSGVDDHYQSVDAVVHLGGGFAAWRDAGGTVEAPEAKPPRG